MMYVTLSNGVKMPQLGYGVYQVTKDECERCVLDALKTGYRSIDTAQSYFNEEEVGNTLQKSGVPREEIFLTSKVWIEHYGYEECKKSVLESMRKLKTDYIDLMLLHQPFGDYYGAWRALEDLYEEGKLRAIGISNFYPDRMIDIASFSKIKPMVNQIEIHPHNQQKAAKEWNEKYGVQLEAWAPFGEGRGGIFDLPELKAIAESHKKTVAQVIIRWHLQRGIVVIPKSTHIERMEENFDVFDFTITDEEMAKIAALDKDTSSPDSENEAPEGNKTLVVYYSATGSTKAVAETISDTLGADIFEIVPEEPYSSSDLDWTNSDSRVCAEHNDESKRSVPLTKSVPDNWEQYDTVYVGYPIWWGIAAWPINGFIEANDFSGKTVIPFCTSASSGLGSSGELLEEAAGSGSWLEGKRFPSNAAKEDISKWLSEISAN